MPGFDKNRIVNFDEKQLQEFVCGICQDVLNNPMATKCCRQSFCKDCIDEWLLRHNTCPTDRKPMNSSDLVDVPRLVLNLIDGMQIKCQYSRCSIVETIGKIDEHQKNCEFGYCKVCGCDEPGNDHDCLIHVMQENYNLKEKITELEALNSALDIKTKDMKSNNVVMTREVKRLKIELNKVKKELTSNNLELNLVKQTLTDDFNKFQTQIKSLKSQLNVNVNDEKITLLSLSE